MAWVLFTKYYYRLCIIKITSDGILKTVCLQDICCNEVCRCLRNQKSLLEQHVSMTPGKLKAHNDFRQGNIFQGSLKLFAAQYKQKSPSTTFYRYIQKKKF